MAFARRILGFAAVLIAWMPIFIRGDVILPWSSRTKRKDSGLARSVRPPITQLPRGFVSSPPLAFAAPVLNPTDLWAIRIASAALTYFGFVAVNDRPRGGLSVPEACLEIKESLVPGAGLGLFWHKIYRGAPCWVNILVWSCH